MTTDYKAEFLRERTMRQEAEKLLEDKSSELYTSLQILEETLENLKASQNQLVQTEKMASLGVLTAGVAHEINNPIGYITSNINSLQEGLKYIQGFISDMQPCIDGNDNAKTIKETWNKLLKKYGLVYLLDDFIDLSKETSEGRAVPYNLSIF